METFKLSEPKFSKACDKLYSKIDELVHSLDLEKQQNAEEHHQTSQNTDNSFLKAIDSLIQDSIETTTN